jgi:SAM-dependent methyltransferase
MVVREGGEDFHDQRSRRVRALPKSGARPRSRSIPPATDRAKRRGAGWTAFRRSGRSPAFRRSHDERFSAPPPISTTCSATRPTWRTGAASAPCSGSPRNPERILDSGCGRGFYLRLLAELGCRRGIGVELRAHWIEQGRVELRGCGAALVRGDVCRLAFADQVFDKAILSEVIEHVPDDLAALRETHRVLRPGGVAVVTVPHADYPLLWDPINKVLERFGTHLPREPLWLGGIYADHYRLYTVNDLIGRIEQAGFRVTDVRKLTHYCIPFAHHLYYGLGKSLLLAGWLPRGMRDAADRFRYRDAPAGKANPMRLAIRGLQAIDRGNDRDTDFRTFLNIAVRAVRA